MAKKAATTAVAKRGSTAVAAGVPDYLKDKKMTGAGVASDASDFLIPMARVLQKMSPEVERRGTQYIEGAEAGDILIKGAPKPLLKGEEGFLFQPCYRSEVKFVEWLPRNKGGGGGAGFVATHSTMPSDATQQPDPMNPERKVWMRKNKNIVVETRYYGGFVIQEDGTPFPVMLPFASSGHTVAKQWNMLTANKRIGGNQADLWAVYYRFTTDLKTRGPNSWHVFKIEDAGPVEDGTPTTFWAPLNADFERGEALHRSLSAGTVGFNAAEGAPDEPDTDKM